MSPPPESATRAQRLEQAERFLSDMGSLLASSLDYHEMLAGVAGTAVRSLADFCVVDVVEDGAIRRLQVAHADPAQAELTRELLRFPLDRPHPHISLQALETRAPVLVSRVSEGLLESTTQGEEHRRILEALRPRSCMAIPLLARDRLLGVVLFVSSGRSYDEGDLALAGKLLQLAALEVDSARLYHEARRALLARDRVLGIVAHDLRNPLNAIAMSADVLLDPTYSEMDRAQQARIIARSARSMDRLVQDLLDVARIEVDRLHLLREIQDPRELVAEAVEVHSSRARARGLTLRCYAGRALPVISVDRDRLLQVLSNLIGNAVKFTPEGGSIAVRAERVAGGVGFSVSDTGPGIPAEDLPLIFQPFWQAEPGRLDGAGLGLMIARGIVEAHGGAIRAESVPGKGAAFHFTIPAAPRPPGAERRHGSADRRAAEEAIDAVPV